MKSSDPDYDSATPVALEVWKDPQNYVITRHVRDEAWVYFRCWEKAGEDAEFIGCLHFEGVWHLEFNRFLESRGYPNVMETDLFSYYLIVENSRLIKSLVAQRSRHDPDWRKYDHRQYRHFVIESHDFFVTIIAAKTTFSTVHGERAARYFELWEQV